MGAYTWLSEQEMESLSQVESPEVNKLFQEVRGLVPDKYFVHESMIWHKRKWWQGGVKEFHYGYTLYVISRHPEVMVFNFPSLKGNMNFGCDGPTLMTYFFGVINGISHTEPPTP